MKDFLRKSSLVSEVERGREREGEGEGEMLSIALNADTVRKMDLGGP